MCISPLVFPPSKKAELYNALLALLARAAGKLTWLTVDAPTMSCMPKFESLKHVVIDLHYLEDSIMLSKAQLPCLETLSLSWTSTATQTSVDSILCRACVYRCRSSLQTGCGCHQAASFHLCLYDGTNDAYEDKHLWYEDHLDKVVKALDTHPAALRSLSLTCIFWHRDC